MRRLATLSVLVFSFSAMFAAASHAQTVDDLYREGVSARNAREFEKASDYLRRALALEPENSDALVQLGFAELALDRRDKARISFEKALDVAPDYEDARLGLALVAFREFDLATAERLALRVREAQPDNAEAQALLGRISQARAALGKPETSRNNKTERVAGLVAEGDELRQAGRLPEAEELFREALALRPDDVDVMVRLAGVLVGLGRIDEARILYEEVVDRAPGYLDARIGLARIALRQQRYSDAEAGFRDVLVVEPGNVDALVGLGDTLRALRREKEARAAFLSASELAPDDAAVRARLEAAPAYAWRLDLGGEYSILTDGRPDWTDNTLTLTRIFSDDTSAALSVRTVNRGAGTDIQIGARLDRRLSEGLSLYGAFAATPEADVLPRTSFAVGAVLSAASYTHSLSGVTFDMEAKHDRYSDLDVTTFGLGAAYRLSETIGIYGRWIHAGGAGVDVDGYLARLDVSPADRLTGFIGYSDAPEIAVGSFVDVQTFFTGWAYDFSDELTLRTSFAYERRQAFDRSTIGLGISYRY